MAGVPWFEPWTDGYSSNMACQRKTDRPNLPVNLKKNIKDGSKSDAQDTRYTAGPVRSSDPAMFALHSSFFKMVVKRLQYAQDQTYYSSIKNPVFNI